MCNNVHGINQLTSDEFNKILLTLIKFQEDLELRYCMSDFLNKILNKENLKLALGR
jgi:hypothetical protein